jgi:D-alanine--poly(phosphoribitol) ligase subunit 1
MHCTVSNNPTLRILSHAAIRPNRVALEIEGIEISYAELAFRAGRLAAWIQRHLDTTDARIGILANRSTEAYVGVIGANMAGVAHVPIGVELPPERQIAMIQRARLTAIVTDRVLAPPIQDAVRIPVLTPIELNALDLPPLETPVPVCTHAPAYLLFTSGTTGTPKPVIVTMGNFVHYLRAMQAIYPIFPDDRHAQFFDLTFDPSMCDIFYGLGEGASLHVLPDAQKMAPARFIREKRLTVMASVPSIVGFMTRLKQLEPGIFPSLRHTIFGGEPLRKSHVDAWRRAAPNSAIQNHYGPAEATITCLTGDVTDPPRLTPNRETIAVGTPVPGMHAGIINEHGSFCPPGQTGQLVVSGPQVTPGYFDDVELTARKYRDLTHPKLGRALFYLTGDMALEDADGHFHVLGRMDHQVKVLGRRVELEEIEAQIRLIGGGEAMAVAWPVRDGAAQGIVAVVAGNAVGAVHLQQLLRKKLPHYMVPQRIIERASLPIGRTGKLDRRAMVQELEDAFSAVTF